MRAEKGGFATEHTEGTEKPSARAWQKNARGMCTRFRGKQDFKTKAPANSGQLILELDSFTELDVFGLTGDGEVELAVLNFQVTALPIAFDKRQLFLGGGL